MRVKQNMFSNFERSQGVHVYSPGALLAGSPPSLVGDLKTLKRLLGFFLSLSKTLGRTLTAFHQQLGSRVISPAK